MPIGSAPDDILMHLSESLGRIEGTLKSVQTELTRSVARAHERIDAVSKDVTSLRVQQGRLTVLATAISTCAAGAVLMIGQYLFGNILP
jgi:hypothetical protein